MGPPSHLAARRWPIGQPLRHAEWAHSGGSARSDAGARAHRSEKRMSAGVLPRQRAGPHVQLWRHRTIGGTVGRILFGTSGGIVGAFGHRQCPLHTTGPAQTPHVRQYNRVRVGTLCRCAMGDAVERLDDPPVRINDGQASVPAVGTVASPGAGRRHDRATPRAIPAHHGNLWSPSQHLPVNC